ncbi:ficolin-2-like [Drosophila sulfurigaster albostrigata]|uniref:ficolin-2-like n=1 Tax=Drosophila sulfurigaster albostrigata TaxID=89887 RepID=UPI002D21D085|nr:ficolin-2-like [Drosophila sulfurigaster albostrigata]
MNLKTCIITILLTISQVNSLCSKESKLLDEQCSTYCYQVVKPLLQYVNTVSTMTQEHNELQHTIKTQAQQLKSCEIQSELKSKLSESFEIHNRNQQKLIDQYEIEITNLKSEIKSKDNEIKELQSQNAKTKALQNEITAYKQTSSCLGKLTALHSIRVPITQTMTVSCESNLSEAGTGWTVIQRRKDGSVNFNKTWSAYKEGFGDPRGEFFIGLEKLHLLTQSQPHELYISLGDFFNATRYARYNNFVIGDETELYEMKELGTYSGNAGDSLSFHKHFKFSTPDKDSKCASKYSSGWWFNNRCYHCNLNGRYIQQDIGENVDGIEWRGWKQDRPLKITQMMIRPKS